MAVAAERLQNSSCTGGATDRLSRRGHRRNEWHQATTRTLGLEPGATPAEIKRVPRLAKAYHPTRERAPRFLAIQAP
jgi:hypothetical protein